MGHAIVDGPLVELRKAGRSAFGKVAEDDRVLYFNGEIAEMADLAFNAYPHSSQKFKYAGEEFVMKTGIKAINVGSMGTCV